MNRTLGVCFLTLIAFVGPQLRAADLPHPSVAFQLAPQETSNYSPVITALALDPHGQWLAVSGDDHIIRILRRSTLEPITTLGIHEDWVRSLDFSPDGRLLVSAAHDGRMILWDGAAGWQATRRLENAPALRSARFAPDGQMVAAVGFAPQLFLMGVNTDVRPKLNCGCRDLRAVAYRGDGLVLAAAGRSGEIHLFDANTGSTLGEERLHRDRICALEFVGKSNLLVTAAEDGHALVYDTESRRVIHDLQTLGCKLRAACMIDDSHLAVGGSDNLIYIFNIETGSLVTKLRGHTGSIAALVASDGDLYSGSFDTTVRRWQLPALGGSARVAEADAVAQPEARTSRLP